MVAVTIRTPGKRRNAAIIVGAGPGVLRLRLRSCAGQKASDELGTEPTFRRFDIWYTIQLTAEDERCP